MNDLPLPLGIQCNNPGNLRPLPKGQLWNGQIDTRSTAYGVYCVFQDALHGLRALMKNLISYKKAGVTTCYGFAVLWAPGEDHNSPASYSRFVANALGVTPTQNIDLGELDTLIRMAKAITLMENGHPPAPAQNWFADELFEEAAKAALGIVVI